MKIDRRVVVVAFFKQVKMRLTHFVGVRVGKGKKMGHVLGELEGDGEFGLAFDFLEGDTVFGNGFKVFRGGDTVNRSHAYY